MSFEIVEPSFPQDADRLGPFGDGLYRLGPQATRATLRITPLLDQPGALEHIQMLGNRRLREPERCCQFADGRLALRETGEDGSSRRVAERGECLIEVYSHEAIYPDGYIRVSVCQ